MKTRSKGSYVAEILKALIFAVIISLVLVVLAAFLVKWFNIADNYIKIINQVIKGLSIFIAAVICLKLQYNGWLRGFILGVLFVLIAFVVFSLLGDGFDFDIKLLNDVALGGVTGLISGILSVNVFRKGE